ncbi:N-acetylglucosamine-binding protein GbpA [Pseudomonas protegens]|uniref:N-acetylglucosamine-binding protein GbpA n=1 Tax=Pseudomonas protegens TaxID=380021 RepID=UPI0027491EA0|nr:N-acetylglucosamine-binding protein GbpA [Pseudomonas protegens]MDP9504479.1 N-acetylglucosamine-binding protein GbpA [Pseudomonas protegens]
MITRHTLHSFLKLPLAMAIGLAALSAQQAAAHGYIEKPKSRAFMCSNLGGNLNSNCGGVTYEPQSVEYLANGSRDGYPSTAQACHGEFTKCGPADGTIAAGGLRNFAGLNEQTANRWTKVNIKPGLNTFDWRYTAVHATRNWQFYITKKDWNPNQPLTRDSFEPVPLLTDNWNNTLPTKTGGTTSHKVNIPADRSGYHIVLGTWMVGDNTNTFYQVVDVNIENSEVAPSNWKNIGAVQPQALSIGDKVMTRVFNDQGELSAKQVTLNIDSAELAKDSIWPKALAEKVNRAKLGYQIGELNDKDQVVPQFGKNSIFVDKNSDINSVLIAKEQAAKPGELKVTGMQSEYSLKDGKVDLHFNAIALNGDFTITASVVNAKGETVAHQQADSGNNTPHFSLALKGVTAGQYDLVVVATSKKGELLQQTISFNLKAEPVVEETPGGGGNDGGTTPETPAKYDHVFPEGLKAYKAGTRVLQPKDGKTYQCKPFPYSGYCVQWKAGATHYEPGIGSHWEMAWTRQ